MSSKILFAIYLKLSKVASELVDIVWGIGKLEQAMQVVFSNTDVIKEGLSLCLVHALHGSILNKMSFLHIKVRVDSLYLVNKCTGHLIQHHITLIRHIWLDAQALKVLHNLPRDLTEDLARQCCRIMRILHVWHKLNNVSRLVLPESLRVKWRLVCIQFLHAREISLANANDDDWERQAWGIDYGVNGLLHVHDGTIGQNEQNSVLLIVLGHLLHLLLAVAYNVVNNWCEVGWSE